jgi:ribosome recycling factor
LADDELVLDEAKQGMQKSLDGLQREFTKVRTGRANPTLLEGVMVDYYGTPTALKALATLSAPEARLLTVQPFDPSALEAIEKGIMKADLGLTPANDGKLLRVPIPELTEERRRDLVKQIKKIGEEHKVGVRGARRDGIAMLKDMEKAKEIGEDGSRTSQKKIQDLTDDFVKRIDVAINAKEEDILKI